MPNDRGVKFQTPEEIELIEKLELMAELESDLAALQVDYATLEAELAAFESQYHAVVGPYYEKIDQLATSLVAALAECKSESEELSAKAHEFQQPAEGSQSSVNSVSAIEPYQPPPEALKQVFREIARLVHPDRCDSPDELGWRTRLMTRANVAYKNRDARSLGLVLSECRRSQAPTESSLTIGEQLVLTIRGIATLNAQHEALVSGLHALEASEAHVFMSQFQIDQKSGLYDFTPLIAVLQERIAQAELRIREVVNILLNRPGF